MSTITALRNYLAAYAGLESGAPLWVNYLGAAGVQYSIVPVAGARVLETYLTGKTVREFPFALQSAESTADDLARLDSIGFYEAFADWLDSQSEAGILPDLGSGKTATRIQALTWGYLFEQGDSQTGIYQINCRLEFEQEP